MTKLVTAIRKKVYHPLKRVVKAAFKNHVYVSKHVMTRGFKITGDLGFLKSPPLGYDDQLLTGLDLAGKTVYDVGSHIGIMTLFFSRAVGQTGQVVSFEPNPETFAILCQNADLNHLTNVRPLNLALGEKCDRLTLVYGEYEGGVGTLDQAGQAKLLAQRVGRGIKSATVQVSSLDECIAAEVLPDPDFVKIDVEGYEHHVLLGMQAALHRCKPALLVEMHGPGWPKLLENLRNVVRLLISHGYEIREIVTGQIILEDNVEAAAQGKMLICN